MNTKRIIIFYPTFAGGGITRNLENILNFFERKNIFTFLFSHNTKNLSANKNLNIIANNYKLFKKGNSLINIFSSTIDLIRFLIKNKKINLILSMQNHLPAIIVAKIFKKKIIIRNSEEIFSATKHADNKVTAYLVLFLKFLFYRLSDSIIAISIKSKSSLKKLGIKENKIRLIYNPFIKKILKKKNKTYRYGNEFNIISIGRLTKQKNFINLINVISDLQKEYPFINLIIIGNGPDFKILKALTKINSKISIFNWTKNIDKYYNKSHLFVLNSLYEGLPNILIEAVNKSIPCLSTDCSGAEDILLKSKGGFIVPIDDKFFLKKKIEFILKNYKTALKKSEIAKKKLNRFTQKNCESYYSIILDNS